MDNDDEFNFSTQRPPGESEEKDQFGEPGDDDFPEDYPTLKQQMKFTPAESTILFEEEERRIMEEVMRGGIESTENVDNADLDESALLRQGSLADETISAEYEEPGDSILEETRSDTVLIDETLNKTATESMENLPPCSESILLEQTVSANSPDPNEITLVQEDDEISFMVRK